MKQVKKRRSINRFCLQLALLVILTTPLTQNVFASPYQSLNTIKSAVKHYLEEQQIASVKHKISIGKIDKRLRLVACDSELETFFLPGSKNSGNTTVGVHCASPKEWTFYVPANVKIFKRVAVSRHPLSRGEEINSENIQFIEKEISSLNSGYFTQKKIVTGRITKRALPAGHIFTPKSIKHPNLVLRGEEVTIVVKSNGFQVRVTGEALMDGSARQKIKVKNKASKKVLEAIVTGRGIVNVRM